MIIKEDIYKKAFEAKKNALNEKKRCAARQLRRHIMLNLGLPN